MASNFQIALNISCFICAFLYYYNIIMSTLLSFCLMMKIFILQAFLLVLFPYPFYLLVYPG